MITVSSTTAVDLMTKSNVALKAGTYAYLYSIQCSWTNSSYQFISELQIGSTTGYTYGSYASPASGFTPFGGVITIPSDGTYNITIKGRVTNAQKAVTVAAFQNLPVTLIRID